MANEPISRAVTQPTPETAPPVRPTPGLAPPPVSRTPSFLTRLFQGTSKPSEIIVFRHSTLFYWWPVWAFGFLMAIITAFSGQRMAIVPAGTKTAKATIGEYE